VLLACEQIVATVGVDVGDLDAERTRLARDAEIDAPEALPTHVDIRAVGRGTPVLPGVVVADEEVGEAVAVEVDERRAAPSAPSVDHAVVACPVDERAVGPLHPELVVLLGRADAGPLHAIEVVAPVSVHVTPGAVVAVDLAVPRVDERRLEHEARRGVAVQLGRAPMVHDQQVLAAVAVDVMGSERVTGAGDRQPRFRPHIADGRGRARQRGRGGDHRH
jgi:hypothetical protein